MAGEARPFAKAELTRGSEARPLTGLDLQGGYDAGSNDPDAVKYVVPVRRIQTWSIDQAYWEKGMCAHQNSACKLRQEFTLERLNQAFDVPNEE